MPPSRASCIPSLRRRHRNDHNENIRPFTNTTNAPPTTNYRPYPPSSRIPVPIFSSSTGTWKVDKTNSTLGQKSAQNANATKKNKFTASSLNAFYTVQKSRPTSANKSSTSSSSTITAPLLTNTQKLKLKLKSKMPSYYPTSKRPEKQQLQPPPAPVPKYKRPPKQREMDDFLSSDLDLEESFASNMSLNSPERHDDDDDDGFVDLGDEDVPMDISPAPPSSQRMIPSFLKSAGRPRSRTTVDERRSFGTDVSNDGSSARLQKGTTGGKRLQRGALPFEWTTSAAADKSIGEELFGKPAEPSSDAMDIDSSFSPARPLSTATITQHHPHQTSISPPQEESFGAFFYRPASPTAARRSLNLEHPSPAGIAAFDESSPVVQPLQKKRRSLSPEEEDNLGSSPAPMMSSPSMHKLERLQSLSKPMLRGIAEPLGLNANNKRPRRPVLVPSATMSGHPIEGPLKSAYPDLQTVEQQHRQRESETMGRPHVVPPVRRAFSAMIPSSMATSAMDTFSSSEGGGDLSFSIDGDDARGHPADVSSPAQAYTRRHQQGKTIRRCDGTDDFRSVAAAGQSPGLRRSEERRNEESRQQQQQQQGVERDTPRSKYLSAGGGRGLGGFGDNEAHGKVLPCHRVKEDGLMRITVQTLNALLDGAYNSQIDNFHIIDCRFDYEYEGGHIPGAENINTTLGVEEFLLGARAEKPRPSISGDPTKKTVLVFHCEFSCKRAPTFAKHLRSKDRSMNNHVYPNIHYPEVYVLEGGYCQYYEESSARCRPSAYVRMDDPTYAVSRKEDLDQFRKGKFGRTKSYAYGDGKNSSLAAALQQHQPPSQLQHQQHQPKRNSAPALFAAAAAAAAAATGSVARTRRTPSMMMNGLMQTLQEDSSGGCAGGSGSGSDEDEDEDDGEDLGDSPCPPPSKNGGGMPFLGKKIPRAPLARAETYGPSRMTIGY
ncbi:hypothetical protein PHLCEN_2v3024 [Hermanssonia centrifuga]|uniref:M-phase inducer phosphatase n=1 Tax=Hermanssonia centrifuga TaxID=98765 RepID=A0A2R6R7B1_9APHY|nr:hypothetical protein PHLCEN_2v3024 [Hermanssonia centrifuga]